MRTLKDISPQKWQMYCQFERDIGLPGQKTSIDALKRRQEPQETFGENISSFTKFAMKTTVKATHKMDVA